MKKISPFSTILVFVVLMIIGAAFIPFLSIQYEPASKSSNISVSASWGGASAKLMEMEVTSRLEGLISSIDGIEKLSSVSRKGNCEITVTLKDKKFVKSARFQILSLIRQVYKDLPEGVSYPVISGSASGENVEPIMTYTVNADLPTQQIEHYVEENIIKEISLLEGVNAVELSGATPFYYEISYNPQYMALYKVSVDELNSVISDAASQYDIVGSIEGTSILLTQDIEIDEVIDAPVKMSGGRIIRVSDIAKLSLKEGEPSKYFRINGLNTINITIYPTQNVNTIKTCGQIKEVMSVLEAGFPENFAVVVAEDVSVDLKFEINKIVFRTVLSLIILLLFVLVVSRSFRYLAIISISLAANILLSFIFFVLLGVDIHLYSMAGINIAICIVIDTAIIMIAHYGYYRDIKAFIAILGAQLTTIGALAVIFLLPEEDRANLADFGAVIIINLIISLFVAATLVPALVETMQIKERKSIATFRNKRSVIRFNNLYGRFIMGAKRYKWATFVILILGFGLPVNKLPDNLEYGEGKDSTFVNIYNKTLGTDVFSNDIKPVLYKILGGSLRLFSEKNEDASFFRRPARPQLNIEASLPDGCTIAQMNDIMLGMENYLSQYDEIDVFRTRINDYNDGSITVYFKPELENGYIPVMIKNDVIAKATDFGGANWSITGVDDNSFSNRVGMGVFGKSIKLTGYNYDMLYGYATLLAERLKENGRVGKVNIFGGTVGWKLSTDEYFIDYDMAELASYGLTLADAYDALTSRLYMSNAGSIYSDGIKMDLKLVSEARDYFEVWNLRNEYMTMGGKNVRFSDLGEISKRSSGNDIYREDQQYVLTVRYEYVGSSRQSDRFYESEIERMNEEVLPVGYKASDEWGGWFFSFGRNSGLYIGLLLVVVAIIYFICAMLFESLVYPLLIIGLIPISFIGVFLIFAITGFRFDQGGFASLVMLSGISVNAGIYLINEYTRQAGLKKYRGCKLYIRAFNHRIIPILLTVLSTILGLIPFLTEGDKDVFWFAFALGTMGGLLFSIVALVVFMPVWMPMRQRGK